MDMHHGIHRLKLVWAVLCVTVAGFLIFMFATGTPDSPEMGRIFLGIAVVTASLAGLPFVNLPIDLRLCLGIVGVLGGSAYVSGPGKWPEGFFIALVFAVLLYAAIWVVKGFFRKQRP